MTDRAIIPSGTHAPIAPFSPGMMADNVIYVSGTLAFDSNNDVVHEGDAAGQTRHILETIKRVLETAGSSLPLQRAVPAGRHRIGEGESLEIIEGRALGH